MITDDFAMNINDLIETTIYVRRVYPVEWTPYIAVETSDHKTYFYNPHTHQTENPKGVSKW